MKKFSIILKSLLLLLIIVSVTANINLTRGKNNTEVTEKMVATSSNTVCHKELPNDIPAYKYIYAGIPVVYNCY